MNAELFEILQVLAPFVIIGMIILCTLGVAEGIIMKSINMRGHRNDPLPFMGVLVLLIWIGLFLLAIGPPFKEKIDWSLEELAIGLWFLFFVSCVIAFAFVKIGIKILYPFVKFPRWWKLRPYNIGPSRRRY